MRDTQQDDRARDARYVLRRVTLPPAQGGQQFAPSRATTPLFYGASTQGWPFHGRKDACLYHRCQNLAPIWRRTNDCPLGVRAHGRVRALRASRDRAPVRARLQSGGARSEKMQWSETHFSRASSSAQGTRSSCSALTSRREADFSSRRRTALLHGPEQIADLPVPVAESPGAVRIGHPERSHLVEYLAPNSVFNSLPRQRSSPHLRPDDRLVTIDRVLHHASLGVA